MRSIISVLAVLAVLTGLGLVPGQTAKAQVVATASYERGPRFLLAQDSKVVPVDVSKTPVLARRLNLDLAGATLKEALTEIESQSGLRLSYSDDAVPLEKRVHLRAEAITAAAALTDVLFDAGMDVVFKPDGNAALVKRAPPPPTGSIAGMVTNAQSGEAIEGVEVLLNGTRWRTLTGTDGRYRLVDVDTGSYTVTARRIGYTRQSRSVTVVEAQEATADFALQPAATKLEELVTTAQKREERLIDVPQSVSILPADNLAQAGALQFRDFANTVPGLSFVTFGAGNTQISLRGVTMGAFADVGPTVPVYVDEVPYGGSTNYSIATFLALDVGLFDLDRIEVLRGPQGTLYGASSIGGLLKYVTKRPDGERFGVHARTGTSGTHDGGVSYHGAAAVNAPIVTDKVALRASGFYSGDGGYINNLALGEKNANRSDTYGGRTDLLFTPTEKLSIRLTGFLQNIDRDGEGTADYGFGGGPLYGDLTQDRRIAEPFESRFRLVSGTVTYDLDWAALTSISSYQTAYSKWTQDLSARYVQLFASFGPFGAVGNSYEPIRTKKFTQEVRVASQGGKPLEWLIGGFYTDEDSYFGYEFLLRDLAGQPTPNNLLTSSTSSRYKEYAAFGDLTWHLTDKFDVTGGLRYARNRQAHTQTASGLFGRSTPTNRESEGVFTYLANARYHFSDQATLYLRYATGYRPGGPNILVIDPGTGLPAGPPTFEADRLKSYEIGFKGETEDRRFGIDVAGYYIDWSNIKVFAVRGGFGSIVNAPGGASVRGAELTLTARPARPFTVTGAFAYQDAELSEANLDIRAAKGEQLPNVPHFTAALNADYELPVGSLQPTVGATLRYVDNRRASFDNSTRPQYHLPDYTAVDLRAGFTLGSVNPQLYVRNLFDERGLLSAQTSFGTVRTAIQQPRTIGISVTTHF